MVCVCGKRAPDTTKLSTSPKGGTGMISSRPSAFSPAVEGFTQPRSHPLAEWAHESCSSLSESLPRNSSRSARENSVGIDAWYVGCDSLNLLKCASTSLGVSGITSGRKEGLRMMDVLMCDVLYFTVKLKLSILTKTTLRAGRQS